MVEVPIFTVLSVRQVRAIQPLLWGRQPHEGGGGGDWLFPGRGLGLRFSCSWRAERAPASTVRRTGGGPGLGRLPGSLS